jgi:hypothetical protein
MNTKLNSIGIQIPLPRTFTFHQLSKIRDENFRFQYSYIDMSDYNPVDVFVLKPISIQEYAYGKPVDQHLRTRVTTLSESEVLAFQDISFEQWEEGVKYDNQVNGYIPKAKEKKKEFVFNSEVSYVIYKLATDDIGEIFSYGAKNMLEELDLDEDKWLELISESKKVSEKFFFKPHKEMAITIMAIEMITGYDHFRILWNGIVAIVDELIQTGEIKDLNDFGLKREIARQLI